MRIGYEIGTGKEIDLPLHHLIVTGLTRLSGKTTTIQALIQRSNLRAIAFRTKRGELGFEGAAHIPPFFRERSDWQYIAALLEATMRERLKLERPWIIRVTKGTKSLGQVRENVREGLKKAKGLSESVYTNLAAYLDIVIPQLKAHPFSRKLTLADGLNIMDLEGMTTEMQSLVIQSTMDHVMEKRKRVIVVVPEAWEFMPQKRGNPVKWAAERFIRQGAALGNYLWLDSQDIAGVDKAILKSVDIWILGRQRELNEVQRTIKQLPVPVSQRPTAAAIMALKLGHFFAAFEDKVYEVYVQPVWLDEEEARGVSLGEMLILGPPLKTEEDDMKWKQKYDDLRKRYAQVEKERDQFREAHGLLNQQGSAQHDEFTAIVKEQKDDIFRLREENGRLLSETGLLDDIAKALETRFSKPNPGGMGHDVDLTVKERAPKMTVERAVIHYEATENDNRGRLGILIAEGHFDEQTKAAPILKEMEARGWITASSGGTRNSVNKELLWFAQAGFLRRIKGQGKQGDEWVLIPEAKKRMKVRGVSA